MSRRAKIGADSRLPFVAQSQARCAFDIDGSQAAGDHVEACSQYKYVQLVLQSVARQYALGSDSLDRCFAQIDQKHILLVIDLEVPLLERKALYPIGMRWHGRRQLLRYRRVRDTLPHLVSPEVVGHCVDSFIGPYVREVAEPRHEPALLPVILIHRPDLLWGITCGTGPRVVVEIVLVAPERARPLRVLLAQPILQLPLRRGIECSLPHRKRHIGRPLKDCQVRYDRAYLLNDLDARGAGADYSNPLAGEVYPFLGPLSSMEQTAQEIVPALDIWKMGLGSDPGAQDQVTRAGSAAAFGAHDPAALGFVKLCLADSGAEPYVPAKAELLVDIVKVRPQLVPGGVQFIEVPILP